MQTWNNFGWILKVISPLDISLKPRRVQQFNVWTKISSNTCPALWKRIDVLSSKKIPTVRAAITSKMIFKADVPDTANNRLFSHTKSQNKIKKKHPLTSKLKSLQCTLIWGWNQAHKYVFCCLFIFFQTLLYISCQDFVRTDIFLDFQAVGSPSLSRAFLKGARCWGAPLIFLACFTFPFFVLCSLLPSHI